MINIICGATASGKSAYALKYAEKIDGIIINADSHQVYKEIPIITAQPNKYSTGSHKLYGIINCIDHSNFSVARWLDLAVIEIKKAINIGKTPILVGGTGMYINALVNGIAEIPLISNTTKQEVDNMFRDLNLQQLHQYLQQIDKISATKIKPRDKQRIYRAIAIFKQTMIPLSIWHQQNNKSFFPSNRFYKILLTLPRQQLYQRCNNRFDKMIKAGVIEEVSNIKHQPYPKAIGLQCLIHYIEGKITLDYAIDRAKQQTRNYAKRQNTWFNNQLNYEFIEQTYENS